MRSLAALFASCFAVGSIACGGGALPIVPSDVGAPEKLSDPLASAACAAEPPGREISVSGEVSGVWSGQVFIDGALVIAEGATLEVCPGTIVTSRDSRANMLVNGTVIFAGKPDAQIVFDEMPWSGIEVHGTMSGGYVQMGSLLTCIDGRNTSDIALVGARLVGCQQAFALWNGARFDRLLAIGGHTSSVHGGILSIIDSTIDLKHDRVPPDCAYWSGGGATIDHVRFTGCHCPIHVQEAELGFRATNSIFDGASVPIMIAKTKGEFSGNNIPSGSPHVLDIGGGLSLDVSNNYWGGAAPEIISDHLEMIAGGDQFVREPFTGVGPR